MFFFEEEANLVDDREDLITVLKIRFGELPTNVIEAIYNLSDLETLERLILVAANAPDLHVFIEELEEGEGPFKITGERFNPIQSGQEGGTE
jgi:hypothetical protein